MKRRLLACFFLGAIAGGLVTACTEECSDQSGRLFLPLESGAYEAWSTDLEMDAGEFVIDVEAQAVRLEWTDEQGDLHWIVAQAEAP